MDKKILFVVFSIKAQDVLIDKVLDLAKSMGAKIIALNVIDFEVIRHMAVKLGKSEAELSVDLEEEGWMYLYYIEDRAKDRGINITLIQEEGILVSEVIKCAEKFSVDLVAISREEQKGISHFSKFLDSLLLRIHCPIFIL